MLKAIFGWTLVIAGSIFVMCEVVHTVVHLFEPSNRLCVNEQCIEFDNPAGYFGLCLGAECVIFQADELGDNTRLCVEKSCINFKSISYMFQDFNLR